jgi:hypothetical protein
MEHLAITAAELDNSKINQKGLQFKKKQIKKPERLGRQ